MYTTRDELTIGLAGIARAGVGGTLATALAVFVGRQGSPLAVSLLSAVFFLSLAGCSPRWGALGGLTGRLRALLVVASLPTTVTIAGFLVVQSVTGVVTLRGL